MARTARLSRRFYETFGDENTNELVGLLNAMDATYLAELRALNESNFARFDAKLDQRVAELRGEMLAGFERASKESVRWLVVLLLPVWMGLLVVLFVVLNRA